MEFLVEFEVEVPAGTPDAEVEQHQRAESAAAAKLAGDGHLVRLWRRPPAGDGTTAETARRSRQRQLTPGAVVQDRDWVSFMWSFPNRIPLDEATALKIAARWNDSPSTGSTTANGEGTSESRLSPPGTRNGPRYDVTLRY